MRPVRIEMAGFSSFREHAEVDLTDTDLVAFVGPTGAGKSSVIDAMIFALYGCVSRYDDRRAIEPAIHKLCTEAKVRLDFELNGQTYTAVRVVRRRGERANTAEARLLRTSGHGGEIVLAGQEREMTTEVQRLLGLSFDQFTKTVVLPQGDFAAFLHEDRSERQKLLRQLLDVTIYERMGRLAREQAATGRNRADVLIEQRDARGIVTDEELAALEARVAALDATQGTVTDQLEVLRRLDDDLARARTEVERLKEAARALLAIEVPGSVTELAPQLAAAVAEFAQADDALAAAREARDEAQAAVDDGSDVASLERAIDAIDRLADLDAELAEVVASLEDASGAATAAREAADAAEAEEEQAAEACRAATEAAGLEATIASLVVGEPCPVCAQVVQDLPEHDVSAELERAKRAFAAAKRQHTAAKKEADQLERDNTKLDTQRAALEAERARLAEAAPPGTDRAALQQQLDDAKGRKAALEVAMKAVRQAERTQTRVAKQVEELRAMESELRHDLVEARDSVSQLGPPRPKGTSLDADWQALAAWAADQHWAVTGEIDAARQAERDFGATRATQQEGIERACEAVGVAAPLERLAAALATAVSEASHAVSDAKARRTEIEGLTEQIAQLESGIALQAEMGRLLNATGFERWLLQTALDDLVARATERLLELSAGQYSLVSEGGDFLIRDHRNADELRSVRTLSGGETFLASLALALALAENIAELSTEGGPRIESMFLDEGFGTLDPSTLDLVATTMEELSSTGRVIGIVTHIRDLADRMPVRFEVTRDAVTARVERVEV